MFIHVKLTNCSLSNPKLKKNFCLKAQFYSTTFVFYSKSSIFELHNYMLIWPTVKD